MYSSRLGVPEGLPEITPVVELLISHVRTVPKPASPKADLYIAATPVTCGAAIEVPLNVAVLLRGVVEVIATPKAGSTRMYLMNTAKAPTDDINVRRAINMAIDKETMLQLPGWAGFGRPGLAPLPSNMVPNGDLSMLVEYDIPYDLEGANALLDENGWVLNGDLREKVDAFQWRRSGASAPAGE